MTADDLQMLEGLWDELHRGRIYEVSLRDARFHLDGLQLGECVYIDPRPAILETLCHELLHRRHPRLTERTVTRRARRLMACMDELTKNKWMTAYNRVKRKGRPMDTD